MRSLLPRAEKPVILLALGANLPSSAGPPQATLKAALDVLDRSGVSLCAVSRFYESPAWPDRALPCFVNAVAMVSSGLGPSELLNLLHAVETSFGRTRSMAADGSGEIRNAPRTLDLDLIDYDGRREEGPPVLPHPRATARAFVLLPLRDIAPGWQDPVSGLGLDALIARLGPEGGEATPFLWPPLSVSGRVSGR
jgi:2-amino-4-hydroxy-6-hydroxymethyldihydropteridine diphosphokinase